MRLDTYLCTVLGIESRSKAQQLIQNGSIFVNSKCEKKTSRTVLSTDRVEQISELRFVSRGGYKLEAAIQAFSLSVKNLDCIDVGASTGGFTDCMLQYGAKHVLSIDVGDNQLHPSLRTDPRITSLEKTDIRGDFPHSFFSDFLAADLSFISITLCCDAIRERMKPKSLAVFLIKPQFEAGLLGYRRDYIPLGETRNKIIDHCTHFIANTGFTIKGTLPSPISGAKKGNVEELIVVEKQ